MSNSIERFNKRKKLKDTITIIEKVEKSHIEIFLNSDLDIQKVDAFFKETEKHYDTSVSKEEAENFLLKFKKEFNNEKFNKLIEDCRNEVIKSIVTPFGLGKVVAAYDKVGGNVTTIHNANQNIYANEKDKYSRKDYTNTRNSEGKQFAGQGKNSVGSQFTRSQMNKNGNVKDAYTGKTQKADTTSPDHIESLSQYHKDGGFMQDNTKRADFATDENNLALTDRSINQSMRDYDKKEWAEKTKDGVKNKDRYNINKDMFEEATKKGTATKKKHLPTNTEKAKYYIKKSAVTGVNEAAKMGMQQAIGLVMTEFFTAVFDEILDIYKNGFTHGFDDERFFEVLKKRLMKIASRIKNKWKDTAIAFKDGFLSGFISNLVTTVINMFVTTAKRVVRIIREGLFSLFRAVKLLLFPPEDMTPEDAMHEAKKLIATGLIVSLGVIIEEWIDKLIKGTAILEPFSDTLTAIFVGTITGISITMVVYYIDKKRDDKKLLTSLATQIDKAHRNIEQATSII